MQTSPPLSADTPRSVLSAPYRTTTVGMVALVSLVAFEAMAVAAAMPTVAQALDGLGMGLLYASLSVLTLALSSPAQQGANSSALQLCEALTVASALAIGGSLFAALLVLSAPAAYLANFGLALGMAVLGALLVRRTDAG